MAAWRKVPPSLLVREDPKCVAASKIAGFDLNDTLVTSRIGAPGYQVTVADWQYYSAEVPKKLRELHSEGYKLVIFTNQGNIRAALDGKRALAVREYIDAFLKDLNLPVQVFAATQRDGLRKPCVGMWEHLEKKANAGVAVDRGASLYVGDAAGGLGEHSADDLDFAKAVGVKFVHARDFFGPAAGVLPASAAASSASKAGAERPSKAPRLAPTLASSHLRGEPGWRASLDSAGRLEQPLVLVLVGAPGSGKSTFATCLGPPAPAGARASAKASGGGLAGREAAAWRRVSQDLLGSKEACIRAASSCMQQGFSIVVDRTNFSEEQRSGWLELAQRQGFECHCLVFDVPVEECVRRVAQRPVHEGGLAGGGRMVVQKLFGMLEPVAALEAFARVAVVRGTEELEEEVRRYCGDRPYSVPTHAASAPSGGAKAAAAAPGKAAPVAAKASVASFFQKAQPAPAAAAPAATGSAATAPPKAPAAEKAPPPVPSPLWSMKPTAAAATADRLMPAEPPSAAAAAAPPKPSEPAAEAVDEKVAMLQAMGFARAACEAALERAGGDANAAANRLLAERLVEGEE